MNKCQIAEFFDVSRPTVNDWIRRGCPVGKNGALDVGVVAGWRAERDLRKCGVDFLPDLPRLHGELARRRLSLNERIKEASAWPPGTEKTPNLLKVAVLQALRLEEMILHLPERIIGECRPDTLPQDVHRTIISALDEARGETSPPGHQ